MAARRPTSHRIHFIVTKLNEHGTEDKGTELTLDHYQFTVRVPRSNAKTLCIAYLDIHSIKVYHEVQRESHLKPPTDSKAQQTEQPKERDLDPEGERTLSFVLQSHNKTKMESINLLAHSADERTLILYEIFRKLPPNPTNKQHWQSIVDETEKTKSKHTELKMVIDGRDWTTIRNESKFSTVALSDVNTPHRSSDLSRRNRKSHIESYGKEARHSGSKEDDDRCWFC